MDQPPKLLPRRWLKNEITVMQFNCLAKSLEDWFDAPSKYKSWEHRKGLILQQIKEINPDVMALEEIDQFDEFFKPELKNLGYDGYCFFPKGKTIATVLFWKFDVIEKISIDAMNFTNSVPHGDGGFLMALFRHKDTRREFICTACHLKAKPSFDEARLEQTIEILQAIEKEAEKRCFDIPVIMLGDFNGDNDTPYYCLITMGLTMQIDVEKDLSLKANSPLKNWYKMRSAYSTGPKSEPPTTIKSREGIKVKHAIDFIFYSEGNSESRQATLKLNKVYGLPGSEDLPDYGLPCENYGSDHFAIAAKFSFVGLVGMTEY